MDPDELDSDPIAQFHSWYAEAERASEHAAAMLLATAGSDGAPSARVVLLRGVDERGFVLFTNRHSRKAGELAVNPRAALVFHWWELGRQVRVEGEVEEVSAAESENYWRTRPRASQVAAWASRQSEQLRDRAELDAAVAAAEEQFAGAEVPLPPFWGGYRVVPAVVEFWLHRDDRLHDRVRYTRSGAGWARERLAP
jgi:pyridoxamine 5'-phosphate oxidase